MSTLIESLTNAASEMKRVEQETREKMQAIVSPALCEFVVKNGDIIESIAWTQYSPYFNDGEECVFSVNETRVRFNSSSFPEEIREEIEEGGDYEDGFYDSLDYLFLGYESRWNKERPFTPPKFELPIELLTRVREVSSELSQISKLLQDNALSDSMQSLFGNHVRVVVTAGGIEVEDYDHD